MSPVDVNAAERVRSRIRARVAELGWTQRRFREELNMGHKAGWTSGLIGKTARFNLALADLDHVARVLKLTPSDLVRAEPDEPMELRPTERRLLRAVRDLPPAIRDHLVILAEYLMGIAAEEIELLQAIRNLPTEEDRQLARHYIQMIERSRNIERAGLFPGHPSAATEPPAAPAQRVRIRRSRG